MDRASILRRTLKVLKYCAAAAAIFLLIAFCFLFVGPSVPKQKIIWGANFSQKHTTNMKLDWKETYLALLDDLGLPRIKLAAHWDLIEPRQGEFDFKDVDWAIAEAEKRGVKIVPAIGMKTPRWPECHIPDWAKGFDQGSQQHHILEYLEAFVTRYKDSPAVIAWQVENEPFFEFGDCPWASLDFVKIEVDLVKSLDPSRPIMITDTGEFSMWFRAAEIGDVVGTTLYRKVWFKQLERYTSYPFPPVFYSRRAWLVEKVYGKKVVDAELQAEPWGPVLYYDLPLEEQMKTMDIEQFRSNIDFAKRTRFDEAYFWGAEWWYWMKKVNNDPSYWEEIKDLVATSV